MNKEPDCITIKARDLVPYKHAVWCAVRGGKPFANTVYGVRWTDDGMISASLDTHNFLIEPPDADLDFIIERTNLSEYERKKIAEWVPPLPPSPEDVMVKEIRNIAKGGAPSAEKIAKIRSVVGAALGAERDSMQEYTIRLTEENLKLLRWQSVASDAHIDHLLAMVESLAANDETPRVLRAISAAGVTSELRRAFEAERINRAKSEAEVVRLRKVAEDMEGRALDAERGAARGALL